MFGFLKSWILWSVLGGVLALGTTFYFYNENMKNQIDTLTTQLVNSQVENELLTSANDTNVANARRLAEQLIRQADANRTLQAELQAIEQDVTDLRTLFSEHDLTRLAHERPELIERRINEATRNIFDAIESGTRP